MGKKDKDAAYDAFLADLKAIAPGIEEIVKDEKVSAKLREGVLARAEFSAQMDALKAEREEFAGTVAEATRRIAGWQKWYGDVSAEQAAIQDKLRSYVETYGELDDAGQRRVAQNAGMTKEEFEKRLQDEIQRRDIANLKFADDLTDIKIDYRDRFKERLDTTEVFKIAGERGLSLDLAYKEYIADRIEKQRTQEVEDRVKREREDAVREFQTQHGLPLVPTTPDVVHTLDVKDAPTTSRDRVAAALRGLADIRAGRG